MALQSWMCSAPLLRLASPVCFHCFWKNEIIKTSHFICSCNLFDLWAVSNFSCALELTLQKLKERERSPHKKNEIKLQVKLSSCAGGTVVNEVIIQNTKFMMAEGRRVGFPRGNEAALSNGMGRFILCLTPSCWTWNYQYQFWPKEWPRTLFTSTFQKLSERAFLSTYQGRIFYQSF